MIQAFLTQFPEYESRDFGLFTESYGGHYGPEFAYYFEQQNDAIAAGKIQGEKINLVALGINNGWIEPSKSSLHASYQEEKKRDVVTTDFFHREPVQGLH